MLNERQRAAFDALDAVVDDLATIQYRHRQQVQDAETDADQRQEVQERVQSGRRRAAGKLGDVDRPADVLDRNLAGHHATQHANGKRGRSPGPLD